MFGNTASVLVGDFFVFAHFQMMVGINSMRVMQNIGGHRNVIAEGEVLQLYARPGCQRTKLFAGLSL